MTFQNTTDLFLKKLFEKLITQSTQKLVAKPQANWGKDPITI